MSTKLSKNTWPTNHNPEDFSCFGPPATKDGQFDGTLIADLGCFKQGEVDSNKYLHVAVVQSKLNKEYYVYTEHGRVGMSKPGFQFFSCGSKQGAELEYQKYLHSKNDKRGEWVEKPGLGKVLQPKAGKDCYLVRPQTTRVTGLPDARTISSTPATITKLVSKNSSKTTFDSTAAKLIADLNVGTTNYTRSLMSDAALPTLEAIEEARILCDSATKRNNELSTATKDIIYNDSELTQLTNLLFSRIPKKKNRKDPKEQWFLVPQNIANWQSDLDAFESAIKSQQTTTVQEELPFHLETLTKDHFIYKWTPTASRNMHSNLRGAIKIENAWQVRRASHWKDFKERQQKIGAGVSQSKPVIPLHQTEQPDIDNKDVYKSSNTHLLFHGTKSICVGSILNKGLRLPKTLSNVAITGASIGQCIYHADDYKKSIGYTSYSGSYWAKGGGSIKNRKAFMFINDVILGNAYITKKTYPYTCPPDNNHSIAALEGVFMNNEYGIFDVSQINLRYLIEFSM